MKPAKPAIIKPIKHIYLQVDRNLAEGDEQGSVLKDVSFF
jgi:hypothetical protein